MKRLFGLLLLFLLLALMVAGGAGWWLWQRTDQPYKAYAGDGKTVVVEPGMAVTTILAELSAEGVLEDPTAARLYLVYGLDNPPLQAGEYRFEGALSTRQVLAKLIAGDIVTHPVTLVEGKTLAETAKILADAGFGDRRAFEAAMNDPAPIADLDPAANDLEGYLFPDTYRFARGTGEVEIVQRLVETFRQRFGEAYSPSDSEGGGRSLREAVILASVVEKEARLADERPVIAGVYANRLERGIALYADPTVIYALMRLDRWNGNLTRDNLQVDSPYNTYRYPGLPPGPICSPGLGSLRAAADPAEVPYLYFVSRNDGSHVFARTLGEHNRNVNEWQKRYWRRRWAEERAAESRGDSPSP
ncbi:MAG: endolytic transglycosylase MltG [Acidobacteriota bacterium]